MRVLLAVSAPRPNAGVPDVTAVGRLRPFAYPPLRRATYCFFWTKKHRESDSVRFQCIPVGLRRVVAGATARLAADSVAVDGAFRCRPLQVVVSPPERTSRETIRSKRFHPLRKPADRSRWNMLVAVRVHSARPSPIPKCSSAVAATLPAPPAALSPVYANVVRRESMAVTTLIGNLVGGNLEAAVSARERNDSRAISREQAPATTIPYDLKRRCSACDLQRRCRL